MNDLKELLEPVSLLVADLDLQDAQAAEAQLEQRFPAQGPAVLTLQIAASAALATGTICQHEKDGIHFSRVCKPEQDVGGCSIDAVLMQDATGPFHTHVQGEVCLCIPQEGKPLFEGRSQTWMVLPVASRHAPKVSGGRMLILYWWPAGAVKWG